MLRNPFLKWFLVVTLMGHLVGVIYVGVCYGPAREAERSYANAPACPAGISEPSSCRLLVRVSVAATPVRSRSRGRSYYSVVLRSPALRVDVDEETQDAVRRAVRLATEIRAELWRNQITRLEVDGVSHRTHAVAAAAGLLRIGAYFAVVVILIGVLLIRARRKRS